MRLLIPLAALLLLAAALLPAVRQATRAGARELAFGAAGLLLLVGGAIVARGARAPLPAVGAATDRPIREADAGYVGAEACRACHPSQYRSWHASYHRTMTQPAGPASVRADVAALAALGPAAAQLSRRGEGFVAHLPGLAEERPLALVTGSHHMQSYWLANGDGRSLSMFPWAWLLDEQRWVSRDALFLQPPGGSGAASPPGAWNQNCVKCHTTHPRGHAGDGAAVDTRVGDFGIACEACHGPGERHVHANVDPARRYRLHQQTTGDPTITLPTRLAPRRDSEVCAQCHSVWVFPGPSDAARYHDLGFAYRPGDELARSKVVLRRDELPRMPDAASTLAAQPDFADHYWWRDGTVRVTGREYNGLIESPCYQRGTLSCFSCHAMHLPAGDARALSTWADDQLVPQSTDQVCIGCHGGLGARVAAHSHHAAASSGSRCVNCHMPHTTYGLLGATRSHRIASPTVRESLETGRPNACNQCHLDRTLAWTAHQLAAWYGQAEPPLTDDQRNVAAAILWSLGGDAGQRALMAWSFGWADARAASGEAWMTPFVALLLDDPYDAVRIVAGRSLARLEVGRQLGYDFAAPVAARHEVIRSLFQRSRIVPGGSPAVLRLGGGELDSAKIERLIEVRDGRPVSLWE